MREMQCTLRTRNNASFDFGDDSPRVYEEFSSRARLAIQPAMVRAISIDC